MFYSMLMMALAPAAIASAPVATPPASLVQASAVASNSLSGLTTGLTVRAKTGTTLGTVSDIEKDPDGTVRAIIVRSSGGATFRLAATTLSMSGSTVITGVGG